MSYEFKKLSDTEVVSTVGDSASILIEENGVIKRAPKDEVGGGIKVASTAKVGQTIVVKAVDENGNPTEWECADKGGQADWNENDETSMAYIKNRPFYETITEIVAIESQTVNLTVSGSYANGSLTYVNYIPWDGICKVIFDGVVYDNIEAYESGGDMCTYVGFTTESGESVSICESSSISGPASLAGQHTIEVFIKETFVQTIDDKFIGQHIKKGTGEYSVILNNGQTASGYDSIAEGNFTNATGACSHSEGDHTTASGSCSHAEGIYAKASGSYSHAEGNNTESYGSCSHAEGFGTKATHRAQHVCGQYNILDASSNANDIQGTYVVIVGNGSTSSKRSNAHTLDWNGNAWYQGAVEGTAMIVKSSTSGSTKRFKITVDDSGAIKTTEITT